ncbi:uncharacterized protein NPIL_666471 [Nephila pilipes]|uniref:Uncharacterized protein n=1 Tax=Nephila pilipes TaxID=299642 RepID=A0A8X6Q3L5_NEPPI|nr:uncharacterized protein NPIL_666471 [Nephila pilipes]
MDVYFWPPLQLLVYARIAREIMYTFDSGKLVNGDYTREVYEKVSRIRLPACRHIAYERTNSTEHQILLPLPTNNQNKLVHIALNIGVEIEKWFTNHGGYFERETNINVRNILSWRSTGIIDRLETARVMIQNERLNITERFRFACEYFFEEDAKNLWRIMSPYMREQFCMEFHNKGRLFWLNVLDNQHVTLDWELISLNITGDQFFVLNSMGIPYFFKRLHGREIRYECIISCLDLVHDVFHPFDLYFCLHRLNAEEVNYIFTRLPKNLMYIVFESFLEWPLQFMFLDVTNSFRIHINGDIFLSLVCVLFHKLVYVYEDCEYADLFKSFWEAFSSQYGSFVEQHRILNKIVNYVLNAPLPFNVEDCGNFISYEIIKLYGRRRELIEIFTPWRVPTHLI